MLLAETSQNCKKQLFQKAPLFEARSRSTGKAADCQLGMDDAINIATSTGRPFANDTNASSCIIDTEDFITSMKAIVFLASSLSIIGALVIIFVSYCRADKRDSNDEVIQQMVGRGDATSFLGVSFEDSGRHSWTPPPGGNETRQGTVQHPARLILVCISAADILVAISHIWGVSNNYDSEYLRHTSIAYKINLTMTAAQDTECGAQAVLAIFGAISSFLWSDVLAFMAVVMLKSSKSRWLKPRQFITYRAFLVYNMICWGIPLIVVCVLGGTNAIGFEEGVDVGWCYIHAHYNKRSERLGWMFFSYELWVSGSMLWILIMVVLFCIILCATRLQERRATARDGEQGERLFQENEDDPLENGGRRGRRCCSSGLSCSKPLILITMAGSLILFRVWATSLDFLLFRSITERGNFHCSLVNPVILAFAGFGNSSQGFVNVIIFILFTGECCKMMRSINKNCC